MSSPPSFTDNDLPRKKKYKIVPNDTKNMTSNSSSVVAPVLEIPNDELPKDRKDLLNFVSFFLKILQKETSIIYLFSTVTIYYID